MYCGEGVVPADCFDDSTMIMLPAALLVLMLIPACVIRCATRGNESKRRRGADVPIEERQLLSINAVPRLRSLDKAESEEKVTPRFRAQELRFYVLFFILMVNIAELYMRYMLREVKPWATSSWLAPLIAEVGVFVAMYTYEKFQEWKRLRYCYVLLIFWMASFAAHLFRMVAYDVKEKDQVFLNNTHLFIVICYFIMIMIEFYSLMRGPVMVPHDDDDSDGPLVLNEVFASFWSYQTYQWFAPVLKMGIKGQLSMPALGRLPIEDRAENRFKTWDRIFTAHKVKKGGNPVLWRVIWAAYKWDLIISAICQGAGTGLQYAGPLVLKGITTYVLAVHAAAAGSGASDASADVNIIIGSDGQPTTGSSVLTATDFFANGYVLAFLLLVANTAQAILLNQTQYITTRAGVNLRAAMQVSIYKKSLRIANLKTGATSFGKIVNHMSTDVMKLMNLFNNLMSLWCSPVEMCVTMGILISIVGAPAAFAGFGVTALALPVQIFCGRRMRRAQAGVLRQVDQRLKKTNELVTGMKIIKLYAWESPFVSAIKAIREKELKLYWKLGIYKAGLILLTQGLPVIVPLVAFAVAAGINPDALTPQVTFTSIALFNMLRSPLAKFPIVVNQCIMAGVSVDRLEMFYGSGELEPTYPDVNGTRDIVITETSFSWEENRELRNDLNTLSDVAIRIPAGKLTMVVGAVGSGKSSLISAILGQMHNVGEGQVHLLGDVALVTQKAWIRNQTVRDNILFGKRYSPEFYEKVVHDSALLPDFAILTAGDRTEIGENGINVSGGQKQRIAIARAVYSDADTYFFDDPLSALDAHVGTHIFRHVVMDLVYQGKTMVVATHQIQYLQNADVVIVMKDRRVVYQGPWMPEQIDPEIVAYVGESDQHAVRGIGEDGDEAEKDENEGGDKRKKGDGKLVAAEAAESGHISWDVYMAYIKAGGVFIWVGLVFGFYILGSVLRAYQNWWLSVWTDNPDAHTLGYYLGGYTLIGVGTLVCTVMIAASYFIAGIRSSRILHHNMLDNLQKAPMTFWDTTPSGRILNRFSTDINRIDQRIPDIISNYLMSVVQVLSGVVVPGIVSPIFIAPGVGLCIVYYFLQRWFKMTSTELQRLDSLTMSPLYAHFSETLTGIETVRAFKVEAQLTDKMLHKIDANSKTFLFINIAQRWLNVYLNYLGSLLLFAICVISTAKAADLPAGQIALSISYSLTIMQSLAQYVTASSNLDIQMNCVERAKEYAEIPVEPRVDDSNRGLDNWPASGDIVLEGIKMRYRPELPLVLRGVSAHIRDGEKIGICGRTGSGKSSLILTLFRMIELEGGRIIIDGKDISDMCVTTLRSRMAIIPQDPTLFAASVRYNVDPTDIYADEDIWEALQMAQLAHVIQELDGGLDAMVHEGGANFSMGERQLFCLARAFLKRARILFLDEATASLDFTSDAALQNAIRTSFVDCTVLTIAHRINTIADSDRVMVLDDGNLIEFDSPANLMQRDTIYRSLVEASGGGDNN